MPSPSPTPNPNLIPPPSQAASLMNHGLTAFRTSVSGEPRGPLCGMGICFECRNDHHPSPHQRTCQLPNPYPQTPSPPAASSPQDHTTLEADLLIVGAGPAGIAAACVAAEAGQRVLLLDDNPGRGGQLWRNEEPFPKTKLARTWFARLRATNVLTQTQTTVVGLATNGALLAESPQGILRAHAPKTILAPGARELFLPFPGWTHPRVLGAGGLQALAKSGLNLTHRTVVVAGSGPLLLAVAQGLQERGAHIPFVAEQADRSRVYAFAARLLASPAKLAQAIALQTSLLRVPYRTTCWPTRATPDGDRLRVTFHQGARTFETTCEYLACGWGLVPNLELPALLGCRIEHGTVLIDDFQQTNRPGIYTAGETTGIAGLEAALVAGQIAGLAAAGRINAARQLFPARKRAQRFAAQLEHAFALRPDLRHLPNDATLVCRCEDVSYALLRRHSSWREAKLQTRCGMGACQGRVCGAATRFLLGWEPESVRPPLFPASVATLAHLQ